MRSYLQPFQPGVCAQICISSSLPCMFYASIITQGKLPTWIVFVGYVSPFHSQSEVWCESSCKIQPVFFFHPLSVPVLRASGGRIDSVLFVCFFFSLVCSEENCQHRMCACRWEWVEVVQSCLFSSSHCHSTCGCSQLGESFCFICAHGLLMHSHQWLLQSWKVWSGEWLRNGFQPIYLYVKGSLGPNVITHVQIQICWI